MASFRYSAIEPDGRVSRGVMEAEDEAALVRALQRAGRIPVRTAPAESGGFLAGLLTREFGRERGLSRQEVANITRELATMLGAGQDLDRALRFLTETAPRPRARRVLQRLRDAVRDGSPLAAALAQHSGSFPRLYIGLVRAGEAGGQLAETLDRLAVLLERQRRLVATVQSAMIYPTLLMVAAIGSILILLTEVLPQFVPLFQENGVALPRPTQILIATGNAVTSYGLYGLAALLLAGFAAREALRRPGPRLWTDRALLRIPIIGTLLRQVMAARFTRSLGTLLINGVPLIAALGIVREVIGNRAAMQAVEAATLRARGGAGLAAPLGDSSLFPLRTIHLLRLGEETAQLGPMALRAAAIHEEEVSLGVQRLVSLLVPAITIAMGAAVAGIVSSLMLAMLSLNDLAH